jgi:hypothetical protein
MYETQMSGILKVSHPTMSVHDVETAFDMEATYKHSVGERRTRGDHVPYRDTYCHFEFFPKSQTNLEEVVIRCMRLLERRSAIIDQFLRTGGELSVVARLFSEDWIQVSLEKDHVAGLAKLGASLIIQHSSE